MVKPSRANPARRARSSARPRISPPRAGIALVPGGPQDFQEDDGRGEPAGRRRRARGAEVREQLADVYALFPRLGERPRQVGGTLSGGEQQMLAIGRALMSRPNFILMDEPSLGLAPLVVESVHQAIDRIRREMGIGGHPGRAECCSRA